MVQSTPCLTQKIIGGIKIAKTTKIEGELLEKVIVEYRDNNMSLREIGRVYNVCRKSLSKKLEEIGVKTTKGNHYRKYFHDFDYFEIIDNHEKAYFLGLLMADGYITDSSKIYGQDCFGISLNYEDGYIIESLKRHIKATNPVHEYFEEDKGDGFGEYHYKRLLLRSQKTVDDLIDKGVIKQKTLTKSFPDSTQVPDEFIYSYLRGYLDGNGSICLNKLSNGEYSPYLQFTTSENFAKGLKEKFHCVISKDKRANAWNVSFNKYNSEKMLRHMYKHSTKETRLDRKYQKYLKSIKKSETI